MRSEYIGVKANNKEESKIFQLALFEKGFEWVNTGCVVLEKHTNFYARIYDKKIITCYHDPSIDEDSVFLSINDILNLGVC